MWKSYELLIFDYFDQFSNYPKCTLHDDFGHLLESQQFCDLEFIVGMDEARIPAHIPIVAARYPSLITLAWIVD